MMGYKGALVVLGLAGLLGTKALAADIKKEGLYGSGNTTCMVAYSTKDKPPKEIIDCTTTGKGKRVVRLGLNCRLKIFSYHDSDGTSETHDILPATVCKTLEKYGPSSCVEEGSEQALDEQRNYDRQVQTTVKPGNYIELSPPPRILPPPINPKPK